MANQSSILISDVRHAQLSQLASESGVKIGVLLDGMIRNVWKRAGKSHDPLPGLDVGAENGSVIFNPILYIRGQKHPVESEPVSLHCTQAKEFAGEIVAILKGVRPMPVINISMGGSTLFFGRIGVGFILYVARPDDDWPREFTGHDFKGFSRFPHRSMTKTVATDFTRSILYAVEQAKKAAA